MKSSTRRGLIRFLVTASVPLLGLAFVYFFMDIDGSGDAKGPRDLYLAKCGNCHGKNGEGLRGLYPPLAGSDYLRDHQSKLPCMIAHGMSGPILVNGRQYNQAMPGDPTLNEVEVAALINYINHAWGNEAPKVDREQVKERLRFCAEEE